ncbi:hypothetical protein, partial [Lentzea sp. NPDC004782]|uniref:hypothetical protein n=1 Tax=Lentzea sp. NPDC004782 TaxID=3154458 RepID=UPI0033A61605
MKGAFIHVTTRLARPDRTVRGTAADPVRPAGTANPTVMNGAFVHLGRRDDARRAAEPGARRR